MKLKIFILLILLSLQAPAETSPSSVFSNSKGVDELKNSNPAVAQEKFLSGLAKDPFEPRLHLNLGLTFEILGQPDKAHASYETALKLAQDDLAKFAANYNLGELAQKAKKVDEALKYYQEALKYNPESKETKTNIELLIQDQQGKGQGEGKEQKDQQNKDQNGQGQDQKEQDQKEQDQDQKNDDQKKDGEQDKPKEYSKNKPQPRKFKSEELSQGDVNKILGEIKQQEQKIRAEFNKKEVKEKPRDKDW